LCITIATVSIIRGLCITLLAAQLLALFAR